MLATVILPLAMSQTGKVTRHGGWYSSIRKHCGASCAEQKARSGQARDLSGAFVGWARTGFAATERTEWLSLPHDRRERGKGAKFRGKIKTVSSSEAM